MKKFKSKSLGKKFVENFSQPESCCLLVPKVRECVDLVKFLGDFC